MQHQTATDIWIVESPAEASSSPIMNLLSVPKDRMLTLNRLHFEILRLLKDKYNNSTCTHPIDKDEKLNHAHVLKGNSRSAKMKKTKENIKNYKSLKEIIMMKVMNLQQEN